jgi:hypothetical protein
MKATEFFEDPQPRQGIRKSAGRREAAKPKIFYPNQRSLQASR